MSAVAVVSALSKIPVKEILAYVPDIVVGIKKLIALISKRKPEKPTIGEFKLSDLEERIENIENFEKEQSELVVNIGNQLENVISAIQIISKRVNIFMILSSIGFLIALTALILVLIR